MLVLDASAAVEIVLQRPKSFALQQAVSDSANVVAPDLFVSEITNVFWKNHRAGIALRDCELACSRAIQIPDLYLAAPEYSKEALRFAAKHRISAYDAFYAVITMINHAQLATLDLRLAAVCIANDIMVLDLA